MAKAFVSVELLNVNKIRGRIRKFMVDFPHEAAEVMYTSAVAVVIPAARENLRKNKNIFTGETFNRLTARSGVKRDEIFVEVGTFGVPYGKLLEEGGAGTARDHDYDRILEWVRKKLRVRGDANQKMVATRVRDSLIKNGHRPHPFLKPAWDANSARFFRDFVNRMRARIGSSSP